MKDRFCVSLIIFCFPFSEIRNWKWGKQFLSLDSINTPHQADTQHRARWLLLIVPNASAPQYSSCIISKAVSPYKPITSPSLNILTKPNFLYKKTPLLLLLLLPTSLSFLKTNTHISCAATSSYGGSFSTSCIRPFI